MGLLSRIIVDDAQVSIIYYYVEYHHNNQQITQSIEDMRGLKIDMKFFLKMLNDEWLVNLKHKPLEHREITTILGHQGLLLQER